MGWTEYYLTLSTIPILGLTIPGSRSILPPRFNPGIRNLVENGYNCSQRMELACLNDYINSYLDTVFNDNPSGHCYYSLTNNDAKIAI